ncbi:MAG: 3',5'-cyclic-AMP phosphodiesterase [Methylomonas sp.]|jgi:Icc protein
MLYYEYKYNLPNITLSNTLARMLKILQITDLHIQPGSTETLMGIDTEASLKNVLNHAFRTHVSFDQILVTGDLAQNPSPASYQRLYGILQNFRTPIMCLPGNHDDFALMQNSLQRGYITCEQYLELQNWRVIALQTQKPDSPDGEIADEQLHYLTERLDAEPEQPVLLAMHHHCLGSGCAWLDTMQISNSAALLECINRYRQIKIVCYGHIHQEREAFINGVGFFSTPATCFQFQPLSQAFKIADQAPGYRVFELYPDGDFKTACYWLPEPAPGLTLDGHGY